MVQRSAVYVIDLSRVNPLDLPADDCGAYGTHSSPCDVVEVDLESDGSIGNSLRNVSRKANDETMSSRKVRTFTVRRQYSWHKLSKDYKRLITKVNMLCYSHALIYFQ